MQYVSWNEVYFGEIKTRLIIQGMDYELGNISSVVFNKWTNFCDINIINRVEHNLIEDKLNKISLNKEDLFTIVLMESTTSQQFLIVYSKIEIGGKITHIYKYKCKLKKIEGFYYSFGVKLNYPINFSFEKTDHLNLGDSPFLKLIDSYFYPVNLDTKKTVIYDKSLINYVNNNIPVNIDTNPPINIKVTPKKEYPRKIKI